MRRLISPVLILITLMLVLAGLCSDSAFIIYYFFFFYLISFVYLNPGVWRDCFSVFDSGPRRGAVFGFCGPDLKMPLLLCLLKLRYRWETTVAVF